MMWSNENKFIVMHLFSSNNNFIIENIFKGNDLCIYEGDCTGNIFQDNECSEEKEEEKEESVISGYNLLLLGLICIISILLINKQFPQVKEKN